jgi:hypothetical protein
MKIEAHPLIYVVHVEPLAKGEVEGIENQMIGVGIQK